MAAELEFLTDPGEFLGAVGEYLGLQPVVSTVVATIAARRVGGGPDAEPAHEGDWWLVVRDREGTVVGAGMRTAPFEPRPAFLLPMPGTAATRLARTLHHRGEALRGVNGVLPAIRLCAEETARLTGAKVGVAQQTRLFRLSELVSPPRPQGHLRPATPDDVGLCREWFGAFMADADKQAGRLPGSSPHETPDEAGMLGRIVAGRIWLWIDAAGERVHLTGVNPPALGTARIGPVYTPPGQRRKGYAGAAVAEVSRRLLADGVTPCLFTDQANPHSNRIYRALGYQPVVDMANLVLLDS